MAETPIIEPVDKKIQAKFVKAEQTLMWLFEHGRMEDVCRILDNLKEEHDFAEKH